ncbi:hypothetical protein SCHPADRAFT_901494 [Schizopora paradoxa]|uniref:Uncharacterized protein n=1 Tax=Schizopora paradoxa TaxID=27342 RepID=A0A0H2SHL4_9AGAM|nr:hypothetical protein SCHPADRAFT_901494 [Schizopora paradoxa]
MTTIVTSFLWSVLQKLWAFCPVLLPTIIVYAAIVPVSLKVWIGAQFAPRMPEHQQAKRRLNVNLNLLPSCWIPTLEAIVLAIFLIISAFVDIVVEMKPEVKKIIMFALLVFPGTYSVSRLPVRNLILMIGRSKKGAPFFIQLKEEKTPTFDSFAFVAGVSICCGAILNVTHMFLKRFCQAILYGSFLHLLLLGTAVTSARAQRNMKNNLAAGIVWGSIGSAIVLGAVFYTGRNGLFVHPNEDFGGSSALVQGNVSFYWSYICFEIIALLYKMDHAFAQESGQVKVPNLKLRQPLGAKPDTSTNKEEVYVVRIPTSFGRTFDKPYFYASLAGLVAAVLFVASFVTCLEFFGRSMTGYEWVRFYLNAVAAPFVCAFPMALAHYRGELGKVWEYGERWMDVPELPEHIPLINDSDCESDAGEKSTEFADGLEFCDEKMLLGEEKEKEEPVLV